MSAQSRVDEFARTVLAAWQDAVSDGITDDDARGVLFAMAVGGALAQGATPEQLYEVIRLIASGRETAAGA